LIQSLCDSVSLSNVNEDDDDEIKEISFKDKGKRVASGSGSTQTTLNQLLKKDIREKAYRQIARFFYTSAIPCATNNISSKGLIKDLAGDFLPSCTLVFPCATPIRIKRVV